MRAAIVTFGCQMNQSDSERLATTLENLGYKITDDQAKSDLIIFNTCSVRQKAEDRVLGQMKHMARFKAKNPNLIVAITGCMTRISSTRKTLKKDRLLNQLAEVDVIFRIEDLPKLGSLLKEVNPELAMREVAEGELKNYFQINPRYNNKFQAFVPIMTGCDKFCTYCIVPFTRGREVSRPIEEIYKETVELCKKDCVEITLLGQNVNSYGLSWADKRSGQFSYETPPFVQLLQKIDKVPGLKRLRFTSPHPQDMTPDVVKAIADLKTLMPYIHLPVQAGSNEVLRRMNRNYTREDFFKVVDSIKEHMPDCTLSTDIIVGFPGETDEQFMETYTLFERVEFDMSFTARFSPRRGTAAQKLMTDDVSREEKARRWHKLNDLLKGISERQHKAYIGKTVEVLVEEYDPKTKTAQGRTPHFKNTQFPSETDPTGTFVNVVVNDSNIWYLFGEAVND